MRFTRTFAATDPVVDLITENYNILPVLSRFDVPLGFGNKTIAEVCKESGIDLPLFLTVVNFILTGSIDYRQADHISPAALVEFLQRSHQYFIQFKFPHIRRNLEEVLNEQHTDINRQVRERFESFVSQVVEHFGYEDKTVFPYILGLLKGERSEYSIDEFRRQHEEVGDRLAELKNFILCNYPATSPYRMYDLLVDICNCEEDLDTHADIENHILIPAITRLEQSRSTPH